jgi:hypothetical protein
MIAIESTIDGIWLIGWVCGFDVQSIARDPKCSSSSILTNNLALLAVSGPSIVKPSS